MRSDRAKRAFDVTVAALMLVIGALPLAVFWLIAAIETRSSGLFLQTRIGRHGRPFRICKLKTMFDAKGAERSSVTTARSDGITRSGRLMRRLKVDELPQLINVLRGEMSLVGPRPDVPGFADRLEGADRVILDLRPGVTGPATLVFAREEELLAEVADPEAYNAQVIWPQKVAINRDYAARRSLWLDAAILAATLLPPLRPLVLERAVIPPPWPAPAAT